MYKRYSPKLKEENDQEAKKLTEEAMIQLVGALKVRDNTAEDSGRFDEGFWDQMYEKCGSRFKVEAERKDKKWWGLQFGSPPFAYDTVDIPYRKKKNQASLYFLFSTCGKFGFVVAREVLDSLKPITKDTIYAADEPYFRVPVERGFFIHKQNNRWYKWK